MDAFFASVEQLDHPEWRGKPVIVGGAARGVVSAASYEARAFGVHSAMPSFQARRLCPQGIFTPGRMERYLELSRALMDILRAFSPLVEQASIDEAYLDASGLERLYGPVEEIGRRIQDDIGRGLGLSCSVGAAPVKFLAKIASDLRKPGGFSLIYPEEAQSFLRTLPLEKIPGLGPAALKILRAHGLHTAGEAGLYSADFWQRRFGKAGATLQARCLGLDEREVIPYSAPKSESAEHTLARDSADPEELKQWLLRQAEGVGAALRLGGRQGRTITLKIKYADFTQITRSHTMPQATNSTRAIFSAAAALLDKLKLKARARLIGLAVSNLSPARQAEPKLLPGLLPGMVGALRASGRLPQDEARERALDAALDAARRKFGPQAVLRGRLPEK